MSSAIEIFCCYAREDQPMLAHLRRHLMPLQRQGRITLWSDTDLNAGDAWEEVLHRHLESADIILLLISADFMVSDYCYSVEMTRALQRHSAGHARVIPILLRATYWKGAPFAELEMLPHNAQAVATWVREDDAFSAIAEKISEVVEELQEQKKARDQEITKLLLMADFSLATRDYEAALSRFEEVLSLNPRHGATLLDKAHTLHILRRDAESLDVLASVEQIDPGLLTAQTYQQKASSLTRLHRHEEALTAINQALTLDPKNDNYYIQKGNMLAEQQKYDQAVDAFQVAIRLRPAEADHHFRMGELLFRLRRFEEALALHESGLRLMPSSDSHFAQKGDILFHLKRPEEALAAYEQAITLRPYPSYIEGKANLCLHLQRYEEALAAYEQAITTSAIQAADPHAGKGQALFNLARYDEAIESFQTAIKLSSPNSDPQFYHFLGLAYERLAQRAYAEETARQAEWRPSEESFFLVPEESVKSLANPTADSSEKQETHPERTVPAAPDTAIVGSTRFILLKVLKDDTPYASSIAFTPDTQMLVSSSFDKTVDLWGRASGTRLKRLNGHIDTTLDVAISSDGRLLASASEDHTVNLWSLPNGDFLKTLASHTDSVFSVAINRAGTLLASGSKDSTIKLWQLPTGRLLKTLFGHIAGVMSVAFSPDGTLLASASVDKTIKLWQLPDGDLYLPRTLIGHTEDVISVAFSPDGTLLASGSVDKTIKLWQLPTGRLVTTLTGHAGAIWGIAFNDDGTLLASASEDKTINLWQLPLGRLLHTLTEHTDEVLSVAFSADGRFLASSSADRTIRLWERGSRSGRVPLWGTGASNRTTGFPQPRRVARRT